MKSEKIFAAIGAVDDELLIRCEEGAKKSKAPWARYYSFAVCTMAAVATAAAVLFCVFALPNLINIPAANNSINNPATSFAPNGAAGTASQIAAHDPGDTALAGLPALDFSLADLHNSSGAAMSRMIYTKIADIFSSGAPDIIAYVRVLDAELWTDKEERVDSGKYFEGTSEKQTSTVHILSSLWNKVEVSGTISVMQHKYGGCCADEETNLLRVGGVYMLPLWHWEEDDIWAIGGDLDVLFEVDDQGRVWSHSMFDEFRRFDGKEATALTESVSALTSDANFPAAVTAFGRITNSWGRLVEVTVLSSEQGANEYGYDQIEYRMRVDDVLSVASNPSYTWQTATGDEIIAISHGDAGYLDIGMRYLLCLDPSEGGPYIEATRAASIGSDGTISAIPLQEQDSWQKSIFSEYNGYTPAQMQEEARRAKTWHEKYAN